MAKLKSSFELNHPQVKCTSVPAPGTQVREAYDRFKASPGVAIDYTSNDRSRGCLRQLRDTYGLDIERVERSRFILVGEYIGKDYINYRKDNT